MSLLLTVLCLFSLMKPLEAAKPKGGIPPGDLRQIFEAVERRGKPNELGGKTLVLRNVQTIENLRWGRGSKADITLSNTGPNKGQVVRVQVLVKVRNHPVQEMAPYFLDKATLKLTADVSVTRSGKVFEPRLGADITGRFVLAVANVQMTEAGRQELRTNREWQGEAASRVSQVFRTALEALAKRAGKAAARAK